MNISLARKSMLLSVLLVSITTLTIGLYAYRTGAQILVEHALKDLSRQVEREELIFNNHIDNVTADVDFVAGTPPIQGIFRAQKTGRDEEGNSTETQWKNRLSVIFSTLMRSKPDYLQVRLLDKSGMELVRVDHLADKILYLPDAQLQNKSTEKYVRTTLSLPAKATYLSAINLNREHGKIAEPHTPVMRISTPVYNNGKLLGLVVINLDVGKILQRIESTFIRHNQSIFITNEQGSYLVHPDHNKRFSFDLGHRHRIQENYPRLASLFLPGNSDVRRTIIPENESDEAVVSRKIYFNKSLDIKRFISIVVTEPYTDIVAAETAILSEAGNFILLLMVILIILGYLFSRHFSKPIQQITNTINKFGTNHHYSPPARLLSRRDEIGIMARAFHELANTVITTQSSLRILNSNLETEIEKRTADLYKSEQRWQFALEGAQQGVWDWDIITSAVYFSKQWKGMLGFDENEIRDSLDEWSKRVHPDDMHQVTADIEKHFAGDTPLYKNEHRVLCKNGSYMWILDQGMVVERDKNNNPLRMIGTHTDISERRRIDKMKNEFISTVSHELRTPLTSIRGSLGLINGGAVGDISAQASSLLSIAYKNTERLLLLINDILDLQKIESGNMPFNFKPMTLHNFINDVVESNRPFAHEHETSIELRNHIETCIQVIADHDRMMQVMNNLLSNAAKFSPPTSVINVDITSDGHSVTIAVRDHGPGIPDAFRDKLFDKFTQSDSSDTRHVGGTGLGLSIAKLIIEKHNGTITYDTVIGQGTSFYIHLPSVSTDEIYPDKKDALKAKDILIIEDDRDIAALLSLQLSNANYRTQISYSAEDAWKLLQMQNFDAITLDISMPGQDGVSFIQQLRKHPEFYGLPIIVISVTADSAKKRLNGGAVGIIDWVNKPFSQSDVEHALRRAVCSSDKSHILYVEDDPDLQNIVAQILADQAQLTIASSLIDARQHLAEQAYEIVLLDVSLPDGSGLDLLIDVENCPNKPQVVIFSANPVSAADTERVAAVLVKSQTSNDELMLTLQKLITA